MNDIPSVPLAHEIKAHLDSQVVGQEAAKIQLSVLLSMHLSWFMHEERMHRSPNAILIGPTGVGKTHTIRVASEYLKVPFIAVDTTSIVPSGIVGLQIEDVLADLVRLADGILTQEGKERHVNDDIELARRGIIFLDEFDKLATVEGSNNEANLSLRLVQRRLLKLIEGAILGVGVLGHTTDIDRRTARSIDTSGILVLAAGAFAGIESNKIRAQRPEQLKRELTNPDVVVSADIIAYGFIPELVARLPILVQYEPLAQQELYEIMNRPIISPAQVWIDHFKQLGKELKINDEAKALVAEKAAHLTMGARGLQQVLFPHLAKIAYDIEVSPETTYEVTVEHLGYTATALQGRKSDAN